MRQAAPKQASSSNLCDHGGDEVGSSNSNDGGKAAKPPAPNPSAAPKLTKDELHARVDLLERTIATLRAKTRQLRAAAKTATSRVAELETELARRAEKAAPSRSRRTPPTRARDPGDAVPPGVGVLEPQPMDAEALAAHDALQEHLSPDLPTDPNEYA